MPILSEKVAINIRFSEVDSLLIVWHGHYLKYFEDAREAFGRKYGLGYLEMYEHGYVTPIVNIHCNYKAPLTYSDSAIAEVTFLDSKAAKIEMEYKITNANTGLLLATGYSTQVFLDRKKSELQLIIPDFFAKWKEKWGIE
ncbi:MAG: acyl-CoA thioesterase [Bacteroidales bacterium]|nr:acyl-CoA thioesterase [Bacteroidales bacterium]